MTETLDQTRERVQRRLDQWQGGYAQLWEYTVSLAILTIRLAFEHRHGNLHLVCSPCLTIAAAVDWDDCHLQVHLEEAEPGEELFVVEDQRAGLRVSCRGIDVLENVDPVYPALSHS